MKIVTLGPQGTFSHQAVLSVSKDAELIFTKTIPAIFSSFFTEKADLAVVPIENSVSGTVAFTIDNLIESSLYIVGEIVLSIVHELVSFGSLKEIKKLYSHPHSYGQCEKKIQELFLDIEIVFTSSNAESALIIKDNKDPTIAAIVPPITVQMYALPLLQSSIQDSMLNKTRFLILGQKESEPTGKDRTSIVLIPKVNEPSVLYNILEPFANKQVNLSKIESRPSKKKLGEYIFFIDFHGHKNDSLICDILESVESKCHLKCLGSYPRVY